MILKKYTVLLIIFCIFVSLQNLAISEEILNSPLDNLEKPTEVTLKGSISQTTNIINKTDKITISLMTILSSDLSSVGDNVEAKILANNNNNNNNNLEALKGSRLIGKVIEVKPSRKAGRAGFVKVSFNTLKIKSGKEFPIKAELTTETFKGKEAGKLILYDAKLITLGFLWGTYNSLKFAPIAAISTNGLSVAASATLGASLGVIGSIRRKGETKTFFPGEKQKIEFKNSLNLSQEIIDEALLANQKLNAELIGLKINLINAEITDSEEYNKIVKVKIKITNNTIAPIYPCDLLLIPKDGSDPIVPDLRNSGFDLLKKVSPGDTSDISLIFPLYNKIKLNDYNLALIDPLDKAQLSFIELN